MTSRSDGGYVETAMAVLGDLHAGRGQLAKERTAQILTGAGEGAGLEAQAWACYLMARIAQIEPSMFADRVLALALESAHLFGQLGDRVHESLALCLASQEAALRGRNDESIDHALLATQLVESSAEGLHSALAFNYLGIATTCTDSDHARSALLHAADLARRHAGPAAAAQPLINLVLCEFYRAELCLQTGEPLHVDPVARTALDELAQLDRTGQRVSALLPGLPEGLLPKILPWLAIGLDAYEGRRPQRPLELEGLPRAEDLPLSWLSIIVRWIWVRHLLSNQRLDEADAALQTALAEARTQQQARMTLVLQHLQVELLQRSGQLEQALAAFRDFRRTQLALESAGIPIRERVARLQLSWREQQKTLESLKVNTKYLEKLSMEDSLTGLANRRCMEQAVESLLAGSDRPERLPWSLVMIDVDHFKQINDRFTHLVGDRVLCQLAEAMSTLLQGDDLAVRLAGDEFVLIVFGLTDAQGERFVQRLRAEVARQDWEALCPGLAVTVSIGASQARPRDTPGELMRRCDLKMYADKIRRRSS
jgi:diguanylate cyclase (GGDEF)-like protein